jgi:hypothetical protein
MTNDNVFLIIVFICIISLIFTLYKSHVEYDKIAEEILCRKSSVANPMANLLPFSKDPEMKACKEPIKVVEDNLFYGFLRNQDDYVAREQMGAFYTLPDTSILGQKQEFSEYLFYGDEDNHKFCKRDGVNCESYRDVRFTF